MFNTECKDGWGGQIEQEQRACAVHMYTSDCICEWAMLCSFEAFFGSKWESPSCENWSQSLAVKTLKPVQ